MKTAIATEPAAAPAPASPTTLTTAIVFCHDIDSLNEHVEAWQDLAQSALEPNAFAEPWLVLPALLAFAAVRLNFVFAYGPTNPPSKKRVLFGVFPLLPARRISRLFPGRIIEGWRHVYAFLQTPLLHATRGGEALRALLDWMVRDREGAALWKLELVNAEGPFARLLTDVRNERGRPTFVVDEYSRAALEPHGADGAAYLEAALPHKRLKEYRRQERILTQRGMERRVLSRAEDLEEWIDAFLALEAAGWKGREGTALASAAAHAGFFRAAARGAFAAGRLLMLGLFVGGKPVALKCNFLSPPGSFAFKIAFDESLAQQSPGVLLEFANVEHFAAARPARWMDSCAVRDHFMINRLWSERRAVRTLVVATGRAPGDLLVSLMPLGRWLKRKFSRRSRKDEGQRTKDERP